jgi:hypothetical protein
LDDDEVGQDTPRPKAVTCWDVADPLQVANIKWERANKEKAKTVQCRPGPGVQTEALINRGGITRVVVINEDGLALGHG